MTANARPSLRRGPGDSERVEVAGARSGTRQMCSRRPAVPKGVGTHGQARSIPRRGDAARAALAVAFGLAGCAMVPKSRLDDCAKVAQALRAENAQLKDTALSLRGENADLSQRAVDDGRKISRSKKLTNASRPASRPISTSARSSTRASNDSAGSPSPQSPLPRTPCKLGFVTTPTIT